MVLVWSDFPPWSLPQQLVRTLVIGAYSGSCCASPVEVKFFFSSKALPESLLRHELLLFRRRYNIC